MSIVEFLRARLDEDEAIARNALGLLGMETPWHDIETLRQRGLTRADARHVARHSSRRVLREVEAKRRIVDDYRAPTLDDCQTDDDTPPPLWVIRALAAVYADHPDYQPDWTP